MPDNIKEVKFGKRAPEDLAQRLRELADEVDEGKITGMVVAYVHEDQYQFMFGASLSEAIVLTTLMQQTNIDRMRA